MSSDTVDQWHITLLGRWGLCRGFVPIVVGRRQRRLLAAVALRGPRARAYFAQLLWPEVTTARAANNLRNTLWHTTHELPQLVVSTAESIDLHPDVSVDVHQLQGQVAEVLIAGTSTDVDLLLDQEPLLPDWYDDWVLEERETLRRLRVDCLEVVARRALAGEQSTPPAASDRRLAVRTAMAACEAEPLSETLALLLIQAHVAAGNIAVGIKAFETFTARLHNELFVRPSGEIVAYVAEITRTLRSQGPRLRYLGA